MIKYLIQVIILITISSCNNKNTSINLENNNKKHEQQLSINKIDSSGKKVISIEEIKKDSIIECPSCSIEILATIAEAKIIENRLVDKLFCTVSENCKNNVEFSEFFNEVCFKALVNNPRAFYAAFQNFKDKKIILEHLENPVNDAVNLKDLMNELNEKLPEDNEITKSIKKAILKY